MNRLKSQCHCCGQLVELLRDHISGPDHYRCSNCFEIVDLDELDSLAELNDKLTALDQERQELLDNHRRKT